MKRPKTDAPDDLPAQDKNWLLYRCRARQGLHRFGTKRCIQHLVDRCLAHHGAKGTQFADWKRACWNWILKEYEFQARRYHIEMPYEPRVTHRTEPDIHGITTPPPLPLGDVLKDILLEPYRENQAAHSGQQPNEQDGNSLGTDPGTAAKNR